MAGFTYYDEKPNTKPTTAEILASLTGEQKLAVLDGFALNVPIFRLKYTAKIHPVAIAHLYRKISAVQNAARMTMRGEIMIAPAELDPQTGEEISPAVYNTPPNSSGALLADIQDAFSADFSPAQVTAILTKMVEYSKHDGSGDWAFYSTNVIL
jgi:hypothetical protein